MNDVENLHFRQQPAGAGCREHHRRRRTRALALVPGYAAEAPAAWHAWIAGAVVALIAAGALLAFHAYEEWANLVVGLWTVAAPWVIGFSAVATAMWTHVIVGVVVAALAAASLWLSGNRPLPAA